MELYSYQGQEPATLPSRIRLSDGSTRTSLNELNSEELQSLGFVGPITPPTFDAEKQKIEWNGNAYKVINLTEEEIERINFDKKQENLKNIDYKRFWNLLITTSIYKKLREAATQSLSANTLCTELISLINDAKFGNPNKELIQKYIIILFLNFKFTEEETQELQEFMDQTNFSAYYTLPNEEIISSYVYDAETNSVLPPAPFPSWTIINGKWESPVPYPIDGKIYEWNEDNLNWIAV